MCDLHIKPFSLYPSTSSTLTAHPVSVPILPPREIQALWSQNHDKEILHRKYSNQNRQWNDVPSYWARHMIYTNAIDSNPDALTEKNERDKETNDEMG